MSLLPIPLLFPSPPLCGKVVEVTKFFFTVFAMHALCRAGAMDSHGSTEWQ